MISKAYYLATLFAVAAAVTSARASSTDPEVVVSAEWLRAHASDPNLVIIAVDMPSMGELPEGYTSGHIPGARVLDFHSIASGMGDRSQLSSELVSPDSLRSIFESLGISNDSHIVVYSSARQPVLVTRTFFTLDYIGLGEHLSVLDGGLDAWKAAGGALEKGAPRSYTRGLLRTNPRMDVLASGPWLRQHLSDPSFALIDARAPEFYTGEKLGHAASGVGHIPSARNLYFATLVDDKGFFKPTAEARAMFANAGATASKPLVVYCHIGQTATVVYLEARRLGIPVKLYDGSFEDWSKHSEYPVAKGNAPQ
jgi:thiosulfate/3-mercaptopyruvate sulfurtransferase